MIWKPIQRLFLNSALWYLFLEQEFVYVGDAGIVEPSGKSRRYGIDFGARYQILDWLFLDADINHTIARAIGEPENADAIPLAPDLTATGGITIKSSTGFAGSIRFRVIGDRPANEDNSIVAKGYAVTDISASYKWKNITFGLQVENLFDTEWNEAQFATESRLQNETESVEEIHFTPGTPFSACGRIVYHF
jgi:outer membrane receptor protein involved in Fe transport